MRWSKVALFMSGAFAGGALDHVILAAMQSPVTPYGIRCGVGGNWLFGGLDAALAVVLYVLHRWLERRTPPS